MDPDPHGSGTFLPGSGSGNIVPDPDPAKYERADNKMLFLCEFWTLCTVGFV